MKKICVDDLTVLSNHFIYFPVLACILLFIEGCNINSNREKPTKLIDGIYSCQTPEECRSFLTQKSYSWEVIEDNRLPDSDPRPPFNILRVSINNYKSMSVTGELVMEYYNNKLMGTWFYPTNVDLYLKILNEKLNVKLDRSSHIIVTTNTRVWISTDYRGKTYIAWEDIRIRKKFNDWISKYS